MEPHHVQQQLCTSRPAYRQGRKLTAVKVYTVASESRHLLLFGVPDLKLRSELRSLLCRYGSVNQLVQMPPDERYELEPFTALFHAYFDDLPGARLAKRRLDATSFFGGVLHICYAPELETVEEVREKLQVRRAEVERRLRFASTPEGHQPRPSSSGSGPAPRVRKRAAGNLVPRAVALAGAKKTKANAPDYNVKLPTNETS